VLHTKATFLNFRNFQSFDASQPTEAPYAKGSLYSANPYLDPSAGASGYHGEIFTPSATYSNQAEFGSDGTTSDFEDEPPLLEG
jgi:hypothetical protein